MAGIGGGGTGSSNSNASSSSASHQAPKILLAKPALVTAAKYNRGPGGGGGGGGPDDGSSSLRTRLPSVGFLNLLSDSWEFHTDRFLPFLTDNTDFTVIGVIGPAGVGKSTIMNEIYGFDGTSPGMLPPFPIETMETKVMVKHCTVGIELRITSESIILLDTQLDEMLEKQKTKIDKVLDFAIDDSILEERITGRWIHASSGRTYHTKFAPPKVHGVDDVTGEPLMQRKDDTAEVLKSRLEAFHRQTEPDMSSGRPLSQSYSHKILSIIFYFPFYCLYVADLAGHSFVVGPICGW